MASAVGSIGGISRSVGAASSAAGGQAPGSGRRRTLGPRPRLIGAAATGSGGGGIRRSTPAKAGYPARIPGPRARMKARSARRSRAPGRDEPSPRCPSAKPRSSRSRRFHGGVDADVRSRRAGVVTSFQGGPEAWRRAPTVLNANTASRDDQPARAERPQRPAAADARPRAPRGGDASSSSSRTGTAPCATIGPWSSAAVTKCTVQPWMRTPSARARRCVGVPDRRAAATDEC
jgi:hypothetical protein